MTDPVNVERLTEALMLWDHPSPRSIEWEDEVFLVECARAVLEAPTAEWCYAHDASMTFEGDECWKVVWMGGKPKRACSPGRVRLVAEEEK